MSSDPSPPWNAEKITSDDVSKKQIIEFLHKHASSDFLKKHKLNGKIDSLAKSNKKPDLITAYDDLFATKAFRNEAEEQKKAEEQATKKVEDLSIKDQKQESTSSPVKDAVKPAEKIGYKKEILKKGDQSSFPKKGDMVSCRYKGTLENGTVFDQNMEKVKKQLPPPLKFKVGTGKVIRGWDEALKTMSVGEVAKLTIDPDWAYGKKGMPEAGIPANSTLIFEVELVSID